MVELTQPSLEELNDALAAKEYVYLIDTRTVYRADIEIPKGHALYIEDSNVKAIGNIVGGGVLVVLRSYLHVEDINTTGSVQLRRSHLWATNLTAKSIKLIHTSADLMHVKADDFIVSISQADMLSLSVKRLETDSMSKVKVHRALGRVDKLHPTDAVGLDAPDYFSGRDAYDWVYSPYTNILRIGCQTHYIGDWQDFSEAEIHEMDGDKAVEFWRTHREYLLSRCKGLRQEYGHEV